MATMTISTTLPFLLLLKVISVSCCQASTDCERCVMENGCVFIQVTNGRLKCVEKSSKLFGSGIPNSDTSADIRVKVQGVISTDTVTFNNCHNLDIASTTHRSLKTNFHIAVATSRCTDFINAHHDSYYDYLYKYDRIDFGLCLRPFETIVLPTLKLSAPRSSSSPPIAPNQPFLTPTPLAPKVAPNIRWKHPIVRSTPLETGRTLHPLSTSSNPIYALPKPYTIASRTPTPTIPPILYITASGSTSIYIPQADELTTSTPLTNFTLSTNVAKSTADESVQTVSTTSMQDITLFSVPASAIRPSTEVTVMESPTTVYPNRVNPYQSPTVQKQIPVVSDVDFKTPITVDFGYKCFLK